MPLRALLLLAAALAAGCARSESPTPSAGSAALPVSHTFGATDRTNAAPSLATRGDRVVLAWSASAADLPTEILVAVSDDAGRTFGAPVRVNDAVAEARTSGEQAPRIAITAREIAVLWTARRETRSEVRLSRSIDGARTFGASSLVHAEGLPGARGWASLTADHTGRLHVVWLDGRNAVVSPAPAHRHGAPAAATGAPAPGALARGATAMKASAAPQQDLYRAAIDIDGRISEARVSAAVCFCCKTAVVTRGDRVLTAWRHIYPESLRDIAFATLAPTGPPAEAIVRVSEDGWKIDGCPDDGPAMAIAEGGRVHLVWPSVIAGPTPVKGIFHATSDDSRAFAPRQRLDASPSSAHPQIVAAGAHGIVAAWDESAGGTRRVVLRRLGTAPDAAWSAVEALESSTPGLYPALGVAGDALLVAWTSQTEPQSTIAVRRLPWR